MSVGIGLAVNNTRAVLEAFSGHQSDFVRTPKLGDGAETPRRGGSKSTEPAVKPYRLGLARLFIFEIFIGLWALAAFIHYMLHYKILVGPILLIQAVGFMYIGVLSLMHDIRARRRPV